MLDSAVSEYGVASLLLFQNLANLVRPLFISIALAVPKIRCSLLVITSPKLLLAR